MRGRERSIVTQIIESLADEELDDDEQMALLLKQLVALDDKDLPIDDLLAFLLATGEEGEDLWLLASSHTETWEECVNLLSRCPQRIPVEPVVTALQHAYARSAPTRADDTDDDDYLTAVINLAGRLGARFPLDRLLPLLTDERILIRKAVIEALWQHDASHLLTTLLTDRSAQIRRVAMQHLARRQMLTAQQEQALALDPNLRVKDAALTWLRRNPVAVAPR